MKTRTLLASALPLLLASSSALAEPTEGSVVRVDVGSVLDRAFGTGVVIRQHPPTIVTCAHVISGQSIVSVYLPSRGLNVPVRAIKAIFTHDVAFLLLDSSLTLARHSPLQMGFAFPVSTGARTSISLFGYSARDFLTPMKGNMIAPMKTLAELGPFSRGQNLNVIPLEDLGGGDRIVHNGDSGAPLYVGDQVVALAAGFVTAIADGDRQKPFAVPLMDQTPPASAITGVPPLSPTLSDPDPYDGLVEDKHVHRSMGTWTLHAAAARLPVEYQDCGKAIADTLEFYAAREDEMPASITAVSGSQRCGDVYAATRELSLDAERLSRKGRFLTTLKSNTPGALTSQGSVLDPKEALLDMQVRRWAGSAELKSSAGGDKALRDTVNRTFKAAASKPPVSQAPRPSLPSPEEYAEQAKEKREQIKQILSTVEIPPAILAKLHPEDKKPSTGQAPIQEGKKPSAEPPKDKPKDK